MYKFFVVLLLNFSLGFAINSEQNLSDENISMTLMQEGINLYKNGRFTDAINILNKSIKHNPKNHISYFVLGLSYDEQGNISQNLQDIQSAYKYVKKSISIKEENTSKETLTYLEKKIDLIQNPRYHKKKCTTCPIGNLLE